MTLEHCIEIMPKFLGNPMYPGGVPIRPENYSYGGSNMREIYFRYSCVDRDKYGDRKPNDENLLIAYTLYYINAPIFDLGDQEYIRELREEAKKCESFDKLWFMCIDSGIDPF